MFLKIQGLDQLLATIQLKGHSCQKLSCSNIRSFHAQIQSQIELQIHKFTIEVPHGNPSKIYVQGTKCYPQ